MPAKPARILNRKQRAVTKAEFVKWMGPLLDSLRLLGNSGRPAEVTEKVAELCDVPDVKLEELTGTGVPKFYNQVAWARQYLVWEGLVSSETRGIWGLTEKGRATYLDDQSASDILRKWSRLNAKKRKKEKAPSNDSDTRVPISIPEIPTQNDEVQEELQDQASLLTVLQSLSPEGFENFCKYLLRRYGFERVEVTPRGPDDGIDGYGVLQLNPFVSFKVIFQCKRLRGTVSRAQVGDLRNAMIGRADKGIMITTGIFSEGAKREASRDGAPPVELIDGYQLVEMLRREEIGVKPRIVYDVDLEFFRPYLPADER